MSGNIVVDMNLSPEWVEELAKNEWKAIHWSTVGKFVCRRLSHHGVGVGQQAHRFHA